MARGDWPWERQLGPLQWPWVEWLVGKDDLKRNCPWKVRQGLCARVSGAGKHYVGCGGQAKCSLWKTVIGYSVLRVYHEWKEQQDRRCTRNLKFREKPQKTGRRRRGGKLFGNCSLGLALVLNQSFLFLWRCTLRQGPKINLSLFQALYSAVCITLFPFRNLPVTT